MMEEQISIPLNARVNLDKLFGNVHHSTIEQPITPYKTAVFIIMCEVDAVLCSYAGDVKRKEDVDKFTNFTEAFVSKQIFRSKSYPLDDYAAVCCFLFSLTEHADMPLSRLRLAVRAIDKRCRGISQVFESRLAEHSSSFYEVMFRREDIYSRRADKPLLAAHKSHMALWTRMICASWSVMTSDERRRSHQAFVRWMNEDAQGVDRVQCIAPPQHPALGCSMQARQWIHTQLHLLQTCPSAAAGAAETGSVGRQIRERYRDVHEVYLLLCVDGVRSRDCSAATAALRAFFDLATMRVNDVLQHGMIPSMHTSSRSIRLGAVDLKPTRYGPLLQARLCRIFGDSDMARRLLTESVQQAQQCKDRVCLRLALVELAAVENESGDSRVGGLSLCAVLDMLSRSSEEETAGVDPTVAEDRRTGELTCSEWEEHELVGQLIAAGQLLAAIVALNRLQPGWEGKVADALVCVSRTQAGTDRGGKARQLVDAATALASCARLLAGEGAAARQAAAAAAVANAADGLAPRHETEAHAVLAVNHAYSLAAECRWHDAKHVASQLAERFGPDNWMAYGHVSLCECLIGFDAALMCGEWAECETFLARAAAIAPDEAHLRRALLLAMRGRVRDASELLQTRLHAIPRENLFTRWRAQMALSSCLVVCGERVLASQLLEEVCRESTERAMHRITAVVNRRLAVAKMSDGDLSGAAAVLSDCSREVRRSGGCLETALLEMAWMQLHIERRQHAHSHVSLTDVVCALSAARVAAAAASPVLEKIVMRECAVFMGREECVDKWGVECRDRAAADFVALHHQFPHHMDWKLF